MDLQILPVDRAFYAEKLDYPTGAINNASDGPQ